MVVIYQVTLNMIYFFKTYMPLFDLYIFWKISYIIM
jgi:hypothetical protein